MIKELDPENSHEDCKREKLGKSRPAPAAPELSRELVVGGAVVQGRGRRAIEARREMRVEERQCCGKEM